MKRGEIDTRDLNLKALTHRGNWKPIVKGINKGKEELFRVELKSGEIITATKKHKFLTNKGWYSLSKILKSNDPVLSIITWKN